MNRRDLLKATAILPLPFSRKCQLDRVVSIDMYPRPEDNNFLPSVIKRFDGGYFEVGSVKNIVKWIDYKKLVLKDGNGNILEVNKLNKGLVLLKLEMMK